MQINLPSEVYAFLWSILSGVLAGLIFDIFRISRKFIKTNDIITYIEDIAFWMVVGIIMLLTAFYFNNGEIRGYIFLGMFLGATLYFLTISNFFMKMVSIILSYLIKIITYISKLIYKPIAFICKLVYKPLNLLTKAVKKYGKQLIRIIKTNSGKWFNFKRFFKIINKKV